MMDKVCRGCGRMLPVTEFNLDRGKPKSRCKDCTRAAKRAWREANKEHVAQRQKEYYAANAGRYAEHRRRYRFSRHGLTQGQFDALLAQQGGGCAICGELKDQMAVDHDHQCCPNSARTCGKCVRGILCHSCNLALGHLGDNGERAWRAAVYSKSPEMEAIREALLTTATSELQVTRRGYAPVDRLPATILRAWDLPESVVTWVLGDDDE